MDGNGRWAKKRLLPRAAGHKEGVNSLKVVLKACAEFGVKYLTVYAFSTENWGRPQEEVDFLMNLFAQSIDREINELIASGVRLQFLGRIHKFSDQLQAKMREAMDKTKDCGRITLNVRWLITAGRAELVDAFRQMTNDQLKNDEINEAKIVELFIHKRHARPGPTDQDRPMNCGFPISCSGRSLSRRSMLRRSSGRTSAATRLAEAIEAYQKSERRFGKI